MASWELVDFGCTVVWTVTVEVCIMRRPRAAEVSHITSLTRILTLRSRSSC